jgi:hypothetical protein
MRHLFPLNQEVLFMLSEVALAGMYVPPFFVYACLAVPVSLGLRYVLVRTGGLRHVWHPALCECALSLSLVSALILYV